MLQEEVFALPSDLVAACLHDKVLCCVHRVLLSTGNRCIDWTLCTFFTTCLGVCNLMPHIWTTWWLPACAIWRRCIRPCTGINISSLVMQFGSFHLHIGNVFFACVLTDH